MLRGSGYTVRDAREALKVSGKGYCEILREKMGYEQRDEFRDEVLLEKMKGLKTADLFWGYELG